MKKIAILTAIVLVCISTVAFAAAVPSYGNADAYTVKFNLFSTSTSTGSGSVVNLGKPFSGITCLATNPTGSTETQFVTLIKGGIDSSNLVTLLTTTSTTFPALFTTRSDTSVPVWYVQGTVVSKTVGTWSQMRIDCVASH